MSSSTNRASFTQRAQVAHKRATGEELGDPQINILIRTGYDGMIPVLDRALSPIRTSRAFLILAKEYSHLATEYSQSVKETKRDRD